MLDLLTRMLLFISNSLLIPVILAIFALLVWTLILAGGLAREWVERRKVNPLLAQALSALRRHRPLRDAWQCLANATSGLPRRFVSYVEDNRENKAVLDQSLSLIENDVAAALARHAFITRIAPIFGLMGTLIPLGPALSGLASGNMQALSGNLIVAFTATVVGLLISGVSYAMGLIRRIWYARDLAVFEALVEQVEVQEAAFHV